MAHSNLGAMGGDGMIFLGIASSISAGMCRANCLLKNPATVTRSVNEAGPACVYSVFRERERRFVMEGI